jgi:pyrroline-5-carboxylate reductase
VTAADRETVLRLCRSFGRAELVSEQYMDAVVGVSGSASAYVYVFIEALADGAVLCGMPRAQAYRFAAQTVLGSAKMVMETGQHPAYLKDMVCSPGGTTIEAVKALEENGFRSAVIAAVQAAAEKNSRIG